MVLTRLPRVQALRDMTLDGLRAGHATPLLHNHRLKDDEALGVSLPLTNTPQLLTQNPHEPYPHFPPWGVIASHHHKSEVLPLGLLDCFIYTPPLS